MTLTKIILKNWNAEGVNLTEFESDFIKLITEIHNETYDNGRQKGRVDCGIDSIALDKKQSFKKIKEKYF